MGKGEREIPGDHAAVFVVDGIGIPTSEYVLPFFVEE
jgi:hypothetical protein